MVANFAKIWVLLCALGQNWADVFANLLSDRRSVLSLINLPTVAVLPKNDVLLGRISEAKRQNQFKLAVQIAPSLDGAGHIGNMSASLACP